MVPPLHPLVRIAGILTADGIETALGGSGLLYALGLTREVHDWDLTTDAPLERVLPVLKGLAPRRIPRDGGPAASEYLLRFASDGACLDLIGHFGLMAGERLCRLPVVVSGSWEGVGTAAPEVWAVAYRLMGRPAKADLLGDYVHRRGARRTVVERLLAEPLPDDVRAEVRSWRSGAI